MWKLCVLVALVAFVLVGCDMAKRIDAAVWQSPDPVVEGEPGAPPPIVEIVAGLLAAGGFGGMGAWLRKSSNGTRRDLAAFGSRLADAERNLERLMFNERGGSGGGGS